MHSIAQINILFGCFDTALNTYLQCQIRVSPSQTHYYNCAVQTLHVSFLN